MPCLYDTIIINALRCFSDKYELLTVNRIRIGGIGLLVYLYITRIGDLLSASVALGSFAIIMWFADNMTAITWNLILIWILIRCVYVVTRSI